MKKQTRPIGRQFPESGSGSPGGCSRRRFIAAAAAIGCRLMAADRSFAAPAAEATRPVRIPHALIRMKSPNLALFGFSPDGIMEITYAEVLKVHGYCGGGAAYAFRMAQEAFKSLYGKQLPVRQAIRVETSHHCCQADALAYITGARTDFGAFRSQGDLVLLPEEDKKTVFTDKATGRSAVLHMHFNPHDTFEPLFKNAMQDAAFAPEVHKALNEKIEEYLTAPAGKLFEITMQQE